MNFMPKLKPKLKPKPLTAAWVAAFLAGVLAAPAVDATGGSLSATAAAAASAAASAIADSVSDGVSRAAEGIGRVDRVGFVYAGSVGGHGWAYRHDLGRWAVERDLGVAVTYVENAGAGADAERVIRELAAAGSDLIFTTSFDHMNPTVKVAEQFAGVKFEHATGHKRAANVSTYSARFYEGRAVAGVIAGHMSATGRAGYVAPFPIPEVVRGINAFTLAMRTINPEATVQVAWVGAWNDPAREGDAAAALIDQGADIIAQHTDSPAPLRVAERRGVYGFGQGSDLRAFAPRAQLTAIVNHWDDYYVARVKAALEGRWASADTWGGIASGMVALAPYGDAVPANVRAAADAVKAAIADGTLHPFRGPFNNQAGDLAVRRGETLDDDALRGMDWYVEGVLGRLPE